MNILVINDDGSVQSNLGDGPLYKTYLNSETLKQHHHEAAASVLVIGTNSARPLLVAQHMGLIDKHLSIIILTSEDDEPELKNQRLLTPFLGDDVRILPFDPQVDLTSEVQLAANRTLARRQFLAIALDSQHPVLNLWQPDASLLLDTLIERLPVGLILLDPYQRIITWNHHLESITGIMANITVNQFIKDLPRNTGCESLFNTLLNPTNLHEHTITIALIGNRERHLSVTNKKLNGKSGTEGHLIVIQDITSRLQAEKSKMNLHRKQAESQRLESLGLLAGGIAHDFNNLLMAIMGNAELGTLKAKKSPEVTQHLTRIISAAKQASELAQHMLAYAGRGQFQIETRDMNTMIAETVQLLSVILSDNTLLDLNLSEQAVNVEMDVAQIRQVLINLVTNAADAIGDDPGKIEISTRIIDKNESATNQMELIVTDSGCGMDKQTEARIFEPFFSTKQVGRGFGLATVLGIINSHKGELRVDSTQNQGTTFTVTLPLSSHPVAPIDTSPNKLMMEQLNGRILVVDDQEELRMLLTETLQTSGYEVNVAIDGESALNLLLQEHTFDMLILDYRMPGLNGIQLLDELASHDIHIPTILCSGYADVHTNELTQHEDIKHSIHKPYALKEMLAAVHAIRMMAGDGPSNSIH